MKALENPIFRKELHLRRIISSAEYMCKIKIAYIVHCIVFKRAMKHVAGIGPNTMEMTLFQEMKQIKVERTLLLSL